MKKFFAWTAALALTATGAVAGAAPSQAAGKTLTYGVITPISSYATSAGAVANFAPYYQAVYDSLIMQKPDGTFIPWLADKWTFDKTRTVLTLHIRKGVKFTDGTVMDAAAAKANLDAFAVGTSPRASDVASILSTTVSGENLVIKMKFADPSMLWVLSAAVFMQSPKTIGTPESKKTPVGSGPYVLDTGKTIPDSVYYYNSNPDYWNPSARKFDNLVIKVLTDNTAAVNALKTGAVDVMNLNDRNAVASLRAAGFTVQSQRLDWAGLTLVDRAGRMGTPLKDVRVRQAINMAFNRDKMLVALANGYGATTQQVFANYQLGYDELLNTYYPFDPAKAKKLLADAGYANGFTINMPNTPSFALANAAIKQALGDIGITVTFTDVPVSGLFAALQQPKFPAYYMSLGRQDPYILIKTQLGRDGNWNPSGYGDKTTDALIAKIQKATTKAELAKLYTQLNRYVVKQAWFAPFFQSDLMFGSSKNVKVQLQPGNAIPYLLYGVQPA